MNLFDSHRLKHPITGDDGVVYPSGTWSTIVEILAPGVFIIDIGTDNDTLLGGRWTTATVTEKDLV